MFKERRKAGECNVCNRIGPVVRGMCTLHYNRWKKWKDPLKVGLALKKTPFSKATWDKWLADLNSTPPARVFLKEKS